MKIYLPHIHYTLVVKRRSKAHPLLKHAIAYTEQTDDNTSTLYLPKGCLHTMLAHELTHVLRNICESRDMEFTKESEHMAYIIQYLMGRVLSYTY